MDHYHVFSGHSHFRLQLNILLSLSVLIIKGREGFLHFLPLSGRKSSWAAILTMIGGGALLADGVITPAITVTSSIEGLKLFNPDISVIPIVLVIFAVLFFMQQFGTNFVGVHLDP